MIRDEWVHLKKRVQPLGGKDMMTLSDDLTAEWDGLEILVKAGYRTDGASIPRLAWRVVGNPWEEYLAAAVVHDILYETEALEREDADRCFLDLMEFCGVGKIRRAIMYRAVKVFGGATWKKHNAQSIALARNFLGIREIDSKPL